MSEIATSNRLQTVLNATYNGIVEVDKNGLINHVNQAALKILDKSAKELIGQPVQRVIPNSKLPEVLRTGRTQIGQFIVIGDHTFVSSRTPIIQDGEAVGAVAVFQDITELQHMNQELEETRDLKELLETVLDIAYNWIVVVDENARITMINKAYCDFLGVKKEDVLGKKVEDVIENSRMQVIVKTGEREIDQIQKIKGHNMICSRIPLKRDGKVWGGVGTVAFRDVSDLKKLYDRVERLQTEVEYYKGELKRHQGTTYSLENIIGSSPRMTELKNLVGRVAKSNSTVLVRGESGTGKEVFAHALHNASDRAHKPFVKVNCAALPENLLESELFGYQEGAFTGARKGGKVGKFELANGGSIFLDEIGDMPLNMQVKLLRVLQEREIERLGDNRPVKIDVRVIAATNRNLEEMVQQGLFRKDLFYRLNVVVLDIPPLRRRLEDIPLLTEFLLKKLAQRLGCPDKILDSSALQCLLSHDWPGNIRELENVLERTLNMVEEDVITAKHLPFYLCGNDPPAESEKIRPLKEAVEQLEKAMLLRALENAQGDCLEAAQALQISKSTFYKKLSDYGISPPKCKPA
ncbi:MAG: sigma 54-interacting transcriptional regulator [Bacillota bacterium]